MLILEFWQFARVSNTMRIFGGGRINFINCISHFGETFVDVCAQLYGVHEWLRRCALQKLESIENYALIEDTGTCSNGW